MGALSYLFFTRLKNQLRQFIRQPSKLVFAAILIACVIITLLPSTLEQEPDKIYRSMEEFYAIVALLYAAVFVISAKNGFSNGASIFSMADVNLIFVSPIKASKALFFGMLQQLGKSLYLGAFLLFQYTLANDYYGIEYTTLIIVAAGYGITALFSQMVATLIYIAVGSSDRKTAIGKSVFYGIIGVFAVSVIFNGGILQGFDLALAVAAVRNKLMYLMPVSGFVTMTVEGIVSGEALKIGSGVLAGVLFTAVYYAVLSKAKGDFYEDVLTATEVSFSAVTAAKEGKTAEITPKSIKVGKEGLNRGLGAAVIREKHRIENRRSRVFILDKTSLVITAMLAIYAFIIPSDFGIFITSVYTLTLTVAMGRWAKELVYPYVYLIPEKPFKKLTNLIAEQIPTVITESIVCFIPVHFILELDFTVSIAMVAARIGFGFIFIGANLVLQRLFSTSQRNVFSVIVYMLIIMLFSIPAVIAAVLVSFSAPFNAELSYLATVPINLAIAFLLLFCMRNVLQYSEYNYK